MKRNVILRYLMAVLMMAAAGEVCAQVKVEGSERGKKAVVSAGKVGSAREYMELLWQAGEVVREESLRVMGGVDSCFVSMEIPDGVWARMQGKSYLENPYIGREDLRLVRVLHHDGQGEVRMGEMVCNRLIAHRLVLIMRQLYDAGYGIERMVLPDVYDADDERQMTANNSSCFCYRRVAGSKKLSNHARGLAVDINPLYNPHCRPGRFGRLVVHPSAGRKYSDRSLQFPYKIVQGDVCYRAFTRQGFSWGGAWRNSKDYQHFEWGDD